MPGSGGAGERVEPDEQFAGAGDDVAGGGEGLADQGAGKDSTGSTPDILTDSKHTEYGDVGNVNLIVELSPDFREGRRFCLQMLSKDRRPWTSAAAWR